MGRKKPYANEFVGNDLKIRDAEFVQNYADLNVYQWAFKSAMQIFELSKSCPGSEKYSVTDQIRRSSRSVCGNIAEAWRIRHYTAHFVSKLSDSDTEAAETRIWLDFALRFDYLI